MSGGMCILIYKRAKIYYVIFYTRKLTWKPFHRFSTIAESVCLCLCLLEALCVCIQEKCKSWQGLNKHKTFLKWMQDLLVKQSFFSVPVWYFGMASLKLLWLFHLFKTNIHDNIFFTTHNFKNVVTLCPSPWMLCIDAMIVNSLLAYPIWFSLKVVATNEQLVFSGVLLLSPIAFLPWDSSGST